MKRSMYFYIPMPGGELQARLRFLKLPLEFMAGLRSMILNPDLGFFLILGFRRICFLVKRIYLPTAVWPEIGDVLFITLRVNKNNRIYVKLATDPVIEEHSKKATRDDFNKSVQGYVYRTAKVGSWIFTDDGYKGFIHESQRLVEPRLGQKVEGRIIDVKEDGTVNVSLLPRKEEALDDDAAKVLEILEGRNGSMPYWDKSMPEEIQEKFHMSKAAFKRALGRINEGRKNLSGRRLDLYVRNKEIEMKTRQSAVFEPRKYLGSLDKLPV